MRIPTGLLGLLVGVVALIGCVAVAPAGADNVRGRGPYCTYSLTTHTGSCFQTERELLGHRSASAEIDLVAVYNWINYSQDPRAGYKIFTGTHNCTGPTTDIDYEVDRLDLRTFGLSGLNMNNAISSVSSYDAPKCNIRFYDGTNFNGDSSQWIDKCKHLGNFSCVDAGGRPVNENWYDRAGSFKLS